MKVLITLKDPNCLYGLYKKIGTLTEEQEEAYEAQKKKLNDVLTRWFKYGEYLKVEVDTEAETCTVVPA